MTKPKSKPTTTNRYFISRLLTGEYQAAYWDGTNSWKSIPYPTREEAENAAEDHKRRNEEGA